MVMRAFPSKSDACVPMTQAVRFLAVVPRQVASLSSQQVAPTYKQANFGGSVTVDQIPALAQSSFPLCMNNLYRGLTKDHHLKHGGRMQFGLFLKGIGLSLEDALVFWRSAFARRTPPDKFNKQYAYNIRHNYGKEGKRSNYTPYGCMKIIKSEVSSLDHHGARRLLLRCLSVQCHKFSSRSCSFERCGVFGETRRVSIPPL